MFQLAYQSHSFRFHISSLIIFIVAISCIVLASFTFYANVQLTKKHSQQITKHIIKNITADIEKFMTTPQIITSLISRQAIVNSLAHSKTFEQRMGTISFLSEMLSYSDRVLSIYAAYANGEFFQLKKVLNSDSHVDINQHIDNKIKDKIKWIVRSITADNAGKVLAKKSGKNLLTKMFLDKDLHVLDTQYSKTNYDPRLRSWYRQAIDTSETVRSDVLLFSSDKELGLIFSRRAVSLSAAGQSQTIQQPSPAVIGSSVYLKSLSESIKNYFITENSQLVLFDSDGELVAYKDADKLSILHEGEKIPGRGKLTDINHPALNIVADKWQSAYHSGSPFFHFMIDGKRWESYIVQLKLKVGSPVFLSISIPDDELYAEVKITRNQTISISLLVILLILPFVFFVAKKFSTPLVYLSKAADAVKKFDFQETDDVPSNISEIHNLQQSMSEMKNTIRRFLDINQVIASEENFEQLLPILLNETISASKADSGALYLVNAAAELTLNVLKTPAGRTDLIDSQILSRQDYPQLLKTAIELKQAAAGRVNVQELINSHLENLLIDQTIMQYHAIALPLYNRKSALVGAMLFLTSDETENSLLKFIEALSSSSAITLETRELIQAQKELFDAFVKLLAGAIDAKSPYTGGHCERVPEITKLLAEAAHQSDDDPFKEFKIADNEWEAIHIASWLHDCGKVTTPEFVVDKATKLETIYDRIHEVRMRFEVLRRDAEIIYWKGIASQENADNDTENRENLEQQLKQMNRQLDDDFAFIAQCNEGGEFMAAEKIEQLETIAQKTWLRTFDDSIGISHEELVRKGDSAHAKLPVVEMLLSNKPEHKFQRRDAEKIPADNPWGFKLEVPELLYNKGELYNLSVAKGTLSEEERFKINEHIIQTIKMLSELPFPKHLQQVTEIAGGHHEKMDGTGYPKRLKQAEMSPVARIMAIADIFEALTATDRPYKKGKTLSEAIRIMGFMNKDRHIDTDLFKLFLTSGIYLQYAEKHLRPEQIDEVDISQYL